MATVETDSSKIEAETTAVVSETTDGKPGKSEDQDAPPESSTTDTTDTTERASWDYTNRKVIVWNVLKFMSNKDVNKMTKSWFATLPDPNSIRIVKTRKAPDQPWIQVTLEHEDMVQPFLEHMNTSKFKTRRGQILNAQRVEPDKEARKRKAEEDGEDGGRDSKKRKSSAPKTDDQVRDVITPYWRLSYDKQLNTKQREMIKKCAIKIVQEVKKKFRNLEQEARRNRNRDTVALYDWIAAKKPIHVQEILPSPTQTQYRNKCEMNFGYRYEPDATTTTGTMDNCTEEAADENAQDGNSAAAMTKIPSVGFMASGWSGGVCRPHMLANIPSEACAVVDVVNEFLKDSPTAPYDSKAHRGLWRVLTIRTSRRTNECMVIILHAPPSGGLGAKDETDDYSHLFESEKARLVSMLTDRELLVPSRDYKVGTGEEEGETTEMNDKTEASGKAPKADETPKSVKVTSIFFQEYEGVSNPPPEHPVQHVFGKTSIHEKLGKCTFQISPGAFFQVNTDAAETLYGQVLEKVREVSPNPEETLLLDVCCGTGTIGQYCMKEGAVGRVVGVDISEPAIEDAKINAELNGFGPSDDSKSDRTRFVAARAEHVLAKELKKEKETTSVIAVVDPARDGLHSDVLKTLRMKEKIQRIVYVSCNPTGSLVRDSGLLCAPPTKKYPGRPFYPSSAQPVDMFPLTPHCEMVMTFDRLPEPSQEAESQDTK